MDRTQVARTRRYRQSARGKYVLHKDNSRRRGIPFELTFRQWCAVWFFSGFWKLRGDAAGQYVMSRRGDRGPYAVGNVYIAPATVNLADARRIARDNTIRRIHTRRSTTVLFVD